MMSVCGSGDASHTEGDGVDAAESTPADPHSVKGKEASSVTEAAKEERGEQADKSVPEQEQPAPVSQGEEQVVAMHPSEALEQKSHFEVNSSYCNSQVETRATLDLIPQHARAFGFPLCSLTLHDSEGPPCFYPDVGSHRSIKTHKY